jgi:hypothetical protein
MERSHELKVKSDQQANPDNSVTPNSPPQQSSIPSPDQIRNLLMVMSDREQKLSELATQQQKFILWRVQFVRLEREWADVRTNGDFCRGSIVRHRLDQKHDQ